MLHVAIVGSREYPDLDLVRRKVKALAVKYPDCIVVSGGCRGVDQVAERAALDNGLNVLSYRPVQIGNEWGVEALWISADAGDVVHREMACTNRWPVTDTRNRGYGAPAFFRNGLIAEKANVVLAFPCVQANGHLGGTGDTIKKAEGFGRKVFVSALPNPCK